MSKVWMIRHGRPSATWGGHDADPGLDDEGHAQAVRVAEVLLALPEPPTLVVSSPLRRCRETAQPFADSLGVKLEIDPGVGEIPTPAAVAAADRPAWLRAAMSGRWDEIVGDLDYERWRSDVAGALVRHAGKAVFSHYVAINAAVSTARNDPQVMTLRPDHTSVSVFDVRDGVLTLLEAGREAGTAVL